MGAKTAAHDHLAALAAPLQPHVSPVYVWARRRWVWVPAWMDPATPPARGEELGESWEDAHRTLVRLCSRLPCPHGVPSVHTCERCRAHVLEHLGEVAARS